MKTLVVALALSAAAFAQPKPEKALYVVTYIDVFPQFAADTAKLMQQFATESLKESGAVRFEPLQDTVRSNHFTMVEVWKTRQDYDAHLMRDSTKRFREKLQPGLGGPFDERMYYNMQ
jgi:quinol monooxygenase YgiN